MKELDLLLLRWLERRFDAAGADERAQFAMLLELPDPQLARYLLGGERPQAPSLAALLEALRA